MSIACGDKHTLTLDDDGNVWLMGQMEGITKSSSRTNSYIKLPLSNIVGIAAGAFHGACVDGNGDVWTFGCNKEQQTGFPSSNYCEIQQMPLLCNIVSVHCGDKHTLCVDIQKKVIGFGSNDNGQLGLGHTKDVLYPMFISDFGGVDTISCGSQYSTFLVDGVVYVCGRNSDGQLGLGDRMPRYIPTKLEHHSEIISICCGRKHTIMLNADNEVFSFGYNSWGQLGCDPTDATIPNKISLPFKEDVRAISCGIYHSMILDESGCIWLFGCNLYGQLSDYNDTLDAYEKYTLYHPPEIPPVEAMSKGGAHTILQTKSGIYVFGRNHGGQTCSKFPFHKIYKLEFPNPNHTIIATQYTLRHSSKTIKSARK